MTAVLKVLADSGYFIGLFDPSDNHHTHCRNFFSGFTGITITTWAVFTEVCAMLPKVGQRRFMVWATQAQAAGYLRIESPSADSVATLWQWMDKYDDLPMDFCDASLVVLAIALKVHHIATTDLRDFSVYRLPGNKRFVHVLQA